MKQKSIQFKVWFAIVAIIVVVIGAAVWLISFLYDELYIDKQMELLITEGEHLAAYYERFGMTDAFIERLEWSAENSGSDVIFSNDPMELGSGSPFEPSADEQMITFAERQQLLDGETVVMIRSHPHFNQDILGVAIPLFEEGQLLGSILLSMPLSEVYEPFVQIRTLLIVSILIVMVVIVIIAVRGIHHVVSPISEMKRVSMRMAEGDFSERIEVKSADELGELAHSFNRLSQALEEVEDNRRVFLANVSHELRTPLSYMKGYAEAMEEGIIAQEKGLSMIQSESKRLERLVNDLLDLAQLEGESYPLSLEPIALAQLVHDVLESVEVVVRQKHLQLELKLDDESIIEADRDRIEQVIWNLMDNAIRYTVAYKKINVTLHVEDQWSVLTIADEGIGIPENELKAVMERFYRVNQARSRKSGGTGLGLAIVSEIVKKHNGEFELHSVEGKGTEAVVRLRNLE
ncbi:sensor histidine kinase [Alkalihalobacillus hemicellulosilyticus]|uniref:histidine kinase n=1 Tax=Halalkalibacter hemicellulosilyticusJCM 9152 TaxID=1236971 RepID=W4QLT1_9BACI|nr:ATP-binding protein [Halalkalibacter hemicellulosilyticus]GAE32598.1 sensor histidine kinase [Halalkalibacter hemicellulosilyticusJCM 9152]